jgi:4-methoxybenzoate monooxygenase (O-demethylating)
VRSLLSAGLDTTIVGIGNALYPFATNSAQWEALREKPALVRPAFDEVLRWESPIQTFFRTTTRAVNIGGIKIPQDAKVLLFLASANRDPRRWYEPERVAGGPAVDVEASSASTSTANRGASSVTASDSLRACQWS